MSETRIVFDLETTGVDTVKDRIVQISVKKIFPDGTEKIKTMLINPTIPIPEGASNVHGIYDNDVKDKPTFSQIAKSMYDYFVDCVLIGYNSDKFDIPLLSEEFNRCDIIFPDEGTLYLDVYKLERTVNSHSLSETYKRYTGKELEGAHDAEIDVNGTYEVFKKQLEKYNLPDDIEQLNEMYNDGKSVVDIAGKMYKTDNVIYWSFGKNVDKHVTEDMGYVSWFLRADFPTDSKLKLKKYLEEIKDLDR